MGSNPSSKPSLQPSLSLQPSSNPSSYPSVFDPFYAFVNMGECVDSAGESTDDPSNRVELDTYENIDPDDENAMDAIASNANDCYVMCNDFYFNQAEEQQQEISGCQVDWSGCYVYHTTNFVVQSSSNMPIGFCAFAK